MLVWPPTTKSREPPWFTCVQVACHILLKRSWWRLQLFLKVHLNRRFVQKVMGFQSRENPNFGNFGSPKTKQHLGACLVARHKKYYKGGRWWLPPNPGRGEPCAFMYACGSSVHQKCFNHTLTNLLFGLYKFMWIIDLLVTPLSPHPEALACSSTPEMLWAKEHIPTFSSSVVFTFRHAFESFKECGGVSLKVMKIKIE
jgi:hypothetical protein